MIRHEEGDKREREARAAWGMEMCYTKRVIHLEIVF